MKLKALRIGIALFALCLLSPALFAGRRDVAPDETPPEITLGLAGATATSVLAFPVDLRVRPDARGRIVVRARLTDAVGQTYAAMTGPRASSTMRNSPAKTNYISLSWDTRKAQNGEKGRWTVECEDAAGNTARAEVELTVQK